MPDAPAQRFAGRTALVTGASGGVGSALALQLASEGARTALVGRRMAALECISRASASSAPEPACYRADLTSDRDLEHLACAIERDLEKLDILIHSAGVIAMGTLDCLDAAVLDRQYGVNLRAPCALTRLLLPPLRRSRGQVVFINSSMSLSAKANFGQYAATKAGLKAMADSLREEVNQDGVRVLSVFIGRTASEMQKSVHAFEGRPYDESRMIQPRDVASVVIAALALDRTAEVTEVTIRPMAAPALPEKGVKQG